MKARAELLRELAGFLMVGLAIGVVLFLSGCSTGPGVVAPSAPVPAMERVGTEAVRSGTVTNGLRTGDSSVSQAEIDSVLNDPERRPGLGTGWGREVKASLTTTHFVRESDRPYGGIGSIYYNDRKGVDAMVGGWKNKTSAFQKAAGGAVEWGVKTSWRYPDHFQAGGKRFVVGSNGGSYSIVVRNVSQGRVEAVLSVDGLDVMDGQAASFRKRGYIIEPGESVEVKGFRTSYEAVARFKFSTVGASYSNLRHGTTRDVGVIGLAVFAERGRGPFEWSPEEVGRRREARAFAEAPLRTAR
ncbi:MAG: hypothetical protein AAGC74_11265 [Verrucomicrobiota bacterium]